MRFPVRKEALSSCRLSSLFGGRIHPITKLCDGHRGIDIAMPSGTPLIALESGTVIYSKVNGGGVKRGYGYYLVIKYDNGLTSLYGHLRELPKLKEGQKVKESDVVAFSGSTGSSTGPHLHFELHEGTFLFRSQVKGKDSAVDPVKYYPKLKELKGRYIGSLEIEEKGDEVLKFENKWQGDLLIETLQKLKTKKVLNNADYWISKAKNQTLTTAELGLLALVMADRD